MRQSQSSCASVSDRTPRKTFLIGQNRRGQWLAVAGEGTGGGIFASRECAIRYAAAETGRRPMAVILARRPIALRF